MDRSSFVHTILRIHLSDYDSDFAGNIFQIPLQILVTVDSRVKGLITYTSVCEVREREIQH